jgi:protein CpxP
MTIIKARTLRWAGIAGAALFAAGLAVAQPGPMHAHGGPGPGIEGVLSQLKDKLNLNTAQQDQWETIRTQGKAAFEAARTARQNLHTAMQAELAKPEPNLAAMAALADKAEADARAARNKVRDQWLQLYTNTFTSEQKAVVRAALQDHMAKMDSFRAKMIERLHSHSPAAGG